MLGLGLVKPFMSNSKINIRYTPTLFKKRDNLFRSRHTSFSITTYLPVRNRVQSRISWAFRTIENLNMYGISATKVIVCIWYGNNFFRPHCIVLRWAVFFLFPLHSSICPGVKHFDGKITWFWDTVPFSTYNTVFIFRFETIIVEEKTCLVLRKITPRVTSLSIRWCLLTCLTF